MKYGHLTEQRKHFVESYFRFGNGTLAAKEAGYKIYANIDSTTVHHGPYGWRGRFRDSLEKVTEKDE